MGKQSNLKLKDGARIAVIGGGPAGSFFSYFLLKAAERVGRKIQVDIYEPRNFNKPGPAGCNMCAGVVSETLVQYLAAEGINLPPTVVERGIDSYMLHMDVGSVQIESALHEKRIAALHRGLGPRDLKEIKWASFDNYLLTLASNKGARVIHQRVVGIDRTEGRLCLRSQNGSPVSYDLVAVAVGVNSAALKLFEGLGFEFKPPRTAKCLLREYYLGEEVVEKYIGSSMHTFLLNIPHLEFAAIIPKGDYVSLAMLGDQIDKNLLQTFLNHPVVKRCLPPDFLVDQASCWCAPRINVKGCSQPFGDQIVFVGDSGVTRLNKDGIGAAYRTAKAAASTAMFQGISAEDFRRHYWPTCRALETDNLIGKLIFTIVRQLQKKQFARRAILKMVTREQQGPAYLPQGLSLVLWDMFTGSAPYGEVFLRTLHPAFWTRFLRHLVASLWPQAKVGPKPKIMDPESAPSARQTGAGIYTLQLLKEYAMQTSGLGKVYQDGEIIIRQGDVGDNMFVIQEGQVEVVLEQDGQEVRLAVHGAGQPIGEMAIFEHQVRSATVRALGQARILTVDRKSLVRRIHEDPSLAYYMMQTMSQRVRELSAEVARLERQHSGTEAISAGRPNSPTCPFNSSNQMGAAVSRSPVALS
jgi:flavin-dependent dehydrogenase